MKNDDLVLVHTTTPFDAEAIKQFLEDNEIAVLLKNELTQSAIAGWATPGALGTVRIYVTRHNKTKAEELIKMFDQCDQSEQEPKTYDL